ncbi:MAG: hypothetical protein HYS05_18940 [Acidobacteria bacterium]|nr:hypothetical protein [Acidobacteriota bacterium]
MSFILATPLFAAESSLSLRVTPRMAFAPAVVSIAVTVEPNAENRALVVEDDSEDYYRRSEVPLEGEKAARGHTLMYQGLPPGEHRISAVVRGTSGPRAVVHTTITIVGERSSK